MVPKVYLPHIFFIEDKKDKYVAISLLTHTESHDPVVRFYIKKRRAIDRNPDVITNRSTIGSMDINKIFETMELSLFDRDVLFNLEKDFNVYSLGLTNTHMLSSLNSLISYQFSDPSIKTDETAFERQALLLSNNEEFDNAFEKFSIDQATELLKYT